MAKDPQVQSLSTSMPGTPTSPMKAASIAPPSRPPEMVIGISTLSFGSRTLRRKDGHISVRNMQSYFNALNPDATESNATAEAPRRLPETGKSAHLSQMSQVLVSSDCEDISEGNVVDRVSPVSLSTVFEPCSAISSPGLSTLRRAGADISTAMGYSSQNMWDIDTDESENSVEGSVFTRTSNATNKGLENMALHIENIDLSPKVMIRRSPTRSTRLSLRRQVVHSNVTRSIWDPEEDEFDRWPGQETLDRIGSSFTLHQGTSKDTIRSRRVDSSTATDQTEDDGFALTEKEADFSPKNSYANLSEQQHEDLIHELLDKECGNPYGPDANDDLMKQFYFPCARVLPATNPARHMHVLNWEAYMYSEDDLVRNALPRLCDAVATVLYLTNPQCLEDFLNPDVKTFEWRRDGHCVMIRREGNQVIVGTYHNFATNYIWTYFVRSSISPTGAWKETFAAVASGITFVSAKGVEFDKFESEPSAHGISPTDEKYTLYMGRELGFFLLQKEVWNYRRHNVWTVLWEADGVVTIPKDHDRYQMWSIKEYDE